jgi:hypothetical protein
VSVIGEVPDEDYAALVEESYANINMSRSEALGMAQLEFMYSGVPVITSGVGGQSWVVKDRTSGMILDGPDDVDGAVAAIEELTDNPKMRKKLGRKSMETAAEYTMPKLIHQFSKKISPALVGNVDHASESLEPGERVIEAWAKMGYRVAVTTRKLLINSAKGGISMAIPLTEISGVSRRSKISWRLLVAGLLTCLAIYFATRLDSLAAATLVSWVSARSTLFPGVGPALVWSFILLPLGVSVLVMLATISRGYSIYYGEEKEVFLPAEFLKALRIADGLTSQSLFPSEAQP